MNLLENTRCYLSGHMQYDQAGHEWRKIVSESLTPMGIKILNPYEKVFVDFNDPDSKDNNGDYSHLKECVKRGELQRVHDEFAPRRNEDLRCCDVCDFSIVRILPEVASWGTMEEVVTLNRAKKPCFIVVVGGIEKTPIWLVSMFKPNYFYNDLNESIEMIQAINNGDKEVDSDRWRLLKSHLR